jgi:hypothetical protein
MGIWILWALISLQYLGTFLVRVRGVLWRKPYGQLLKPRSAWWRLQSGTGASGPTQSGAAGASGPTQSGAATVSGAKSGKASAGTRAAVSAGTVVSDGAVAKVREWVRHPWGLFSCLFCCRASPPARRLLLSGLLGWLPGLLLCLASHPSCSGGPGWQVDKGFRISSQSGFRVIKPLNPWPLTPPSPPRWQVDTEEALAGRGPAPVLVESH